MIGIFDENEISLNVTICPRHRDSFGIRWRSNQKTCSIPNSWAAHRTTHVKGERGITLEESRRLFKVSSIVTPVGLSKLCKILEGKLIILGTPFSWHYRTTICKLQGSNFK